MLELIVDISKNPVIEAKKNTRFCIDFSGCVPSTAYLITLNLNKAGINTEVLGLYNLKNSENVNFEIVVNHIVPNTSCLNKIKGVLHDNCGSDFTGQIIISKDAQQTSSYLSHDVLVVGKNTNNQTSPILKIDANDVKASHSATTGRADETELYYLCSRGLSQSEAESLIVEGFFEKELKNIKNDAVLEVIKKQLVM